MIIVAHNPPANAQEALHTYLKNILANLQNAFSARVILAFFQAFKPAKHIYFLFFQMPLW